MAASDHLSDDQFRREKVSHILSHYQPTDFGTWPEVEGNIRWKHPTNQALVADVKKHGVQRPIPVDYESSPPRVMNGHHRVLAAARAGRKTVPTRQWDWFMDPDDPDVMGRQPDDPNYRAGY
jgi:hypothetical protein